VDPKQETAKVLYSRKDAAKALSISVSLLDEAIQA